MSPDPDGVAARLLRQVMQLERPGYDTQCHSLESDLKNHTQDMTEEQVNRLFNYIKSCQSLLQDNFLEKTITLSTPILNDESMLSDLVNCQQNVDRSKVGHTSLIFF